MTNNQEINVPNIGKSSWLEGYKSNDSIEASRKTLTTENRNVGK